MQPSSQVHSYLAVLFTTPEYIAAYTYFIEGYTKEKQCVQRPGAQDFKPSPAPITSQQASIGPSRGLKAEAESLVCTRGDVKGSGDTVKQT
ncbi:unnamed protein product [Boreogadus saida]